MTAGRKKYSLLVLSQAIIVTVLIEILLPKSTISYSFNALNKQPNGKTKDVHKADMKAIRSLSKELDNATLPNNRSDQLSELTGERKKLDLSNLFTELNRYYENIVATYLQNNLLHTGNNIAISKSEAFLKKNLNPIKLINGIEFLRNKRQLGEENIDHDIPEKLQKFYEMNKGNIDLFEIAYKIQSFLDKIKYAKEDTGAQTIVMRLLSKLPNCLKAIILEKTVCLRNRMFNEYLYVNDIIPNSTNHLVNSHPNKKNKRFAFSLERVRDDVYYIKSNYYDEYLYTDNMKYDDKARFVFTSHISSSNDNAKWKVIYTDANWCSLKSFKFDEFLFLSDVKYNKLRFVFTNEETVGRQSDWSIEPCM